jgi:NADPH-dependent ferric siderophore reductase
MVNYCFAVPILPGGIELMKKWNEENVVNNKEHDTVLKAAGISRETVWVQHHSQQGDLAIASYETDDPEQSFKVLATSNEPWAVKFREHLKKAHGIDIAQSSNMQLNELLANWKR